MEFQGLHPCRGKWDYEAARVWEIWGALGRPIGCLQCSLLLGNSKSSNCDETGSLTFGFVVIPTFAISKTQETQQVLGDIPRGSPHHHTLANCLIS